jgi:histone deacetylase 6
VKKINYHTVNILEKISYRIFKNTKSSNGIGIIRPPGHHANATSSSGFCFFNSIAVAAKYAQKKFESIKKLF